MDISTLSIDEQIAILTLKKKIEEKQAEIKELQLKIDAISSRGQQPGMMMPQAPAPVPMPAPAVTPQPPAPFPMPSQPQFQQPQAPVQPQMPATYQQQVQYQPQQPAPAPYQQPMQQAPYVPQQPIAPGQIPGMQLMYPQQQAPAPMQYAAPAVPTFQAPPAPAMQQPAAVPVTKTGMKPAGGLSGRFGAGKPAGSPLFKPGAGPIAKPGQKSMKSPIAIPGMKQQAPATPQTVSSANYQTIREHAVSALTQAGKPLTFDGLFDKMVAGGCPMPAEKPKVIVRKVLCNSPDVFSVTNKGLYTINESYVPGTNAMGTPPASPSVPTQQAMQQTAAPVTPPQPVYQQPQPMPQMQPVPVPVPQQPVPMAIPSQPIQPVVQQPVAQSVAQPQPVPAVPPQPQPVPVPVPPPAVVTPPPVAVTPVIAEPPQPPAAPAAPATVQPTPVKAIPVAAPATVAVHQKKNNPHIIIHKPGEAHSAHHPAKPATVPPPRRTETVPSPRRTERVQPMPPTHSTVSNDQDSSLESLDTTARRALTSSGQGSIRERATSAILNAGRPLSVDEVFDKLKTDGNPLPQHNAKDVVKTVLNNKSLFKVVDNGRYLPISD